MSLLDDTAGNPTTPDSVFAHLLEICNLDTGLGMNDDGSGLLEITYARSDTGLPAQRIDTLVNTNFGVPPTDIDIVVAGVGSDFVLTLSDGTVTQINQIAGTVFMPMATGNPTTSILLIYDTGQCNGNGYQVDAEGGGSTSFPSSVILFHELSHAHDFATSTATTERDAEIDENLMRDQLGITHRDVDSHNGACGGGSSDCCMIASIASGSPYSSTVSSLRRVRDAFLRRTEVGHDFFERLYFDYYEFSPTVTRAMAGSPAFREEVQRFVVEPLVVILEAIRARAFEGAPPEAVARKLREHAFQMPVTGDATMFADSYRGATGAVTGLSNLSAKSFERWIPLIEKSPYLKWSLAQPMVFFAEALGAIRKGETDQEVGALLERRLDEWSSELPLTPLWSEGSRSTVEVELEFLDRALLLSERAKRRFRERIDEARRERTSTVGQS